MPGRKFDVKAISSNVETSPMGVAGAPRTALTLLHCNRQIVSAHAALQPIFCHKIMTLRDTFAWGRTRFM
jgi:hypothetical protein